MAAFVRENVDKLDDLPASHADRMRVCEGAGWTGRQYLTALSRATLHRAAGTATDDVALDMYRERLALCLAGFAPEDGSVEAGRLRVYDAGRDGYSVNDKVYWDAHQVVREYHGFYLNSGAAYSVVEGARFDEFGCPAGNYAAGWKGARKPDFRVDVHDDVFRATLSRLGWPDERLDALRTLDDVVAARDADPFLRALADDRVPFSASSREKRVEAARRLAPEVARSGVRAVLRDSEDWGLSSPGESRTHRELTRLVPPPGGEAFTFPVDVPDVFRADVAAAEDELKAAGAPVIAKASMRVGNFGYGKTVWGEERKTFRSMEGVRWAIRTDAMAAMRSSYDVVHTAAATDAQRAEMARLVEEQKASGRGAHLGTFRGTVVRDPDVVATIESQEAREPVVGVLTAAGAAPEKFRTREGLALAMDRARRDPALSLLLPRQEDDKGARFVVYEAVRDVAGDVAKGFRSRDFEEWDRTSGAILRERDVDWREVAPEAARDPRVRAVEAEDAARAAGLPHVAEIRHPNGNARFRTMDGLRYGLGRVYDSATGGLSDGARLLVLAGTDEAGLRAVHGAVREVQGRPATDFEEWRRTRLREPGVPGRTRVRGAVEAAMAAARDVGTPGSGASPSDELEGEALGE